MSLFSERKDRSVQSLVLKLVNNTCPELTMWLEGPRSNSRINLVVVAMVIPIENGQPQVDKAFTAVTKEFSNTGVGVIFGHRPGLDQVIIGFMFEGKMAFIRAEAKHTDPMGGGFYQLGFQLTEVISVADFPELQKLSI
jgi:hypothetical protein